MGFVFIKNNISVYINLFAIAIIDIVISDIYIDIFLQNFNTSSVVALNFYIINIAIITIKTFTVFHRSVVIFITIRIIIPNNW